MTAAEPLIPLLWPPGFETRGTELYAILDGARDPRIHKLVNASELAWCCLYAGRLPAELLEVAPYLVQLQPDAAFTRTLLAAGWGHAWGIWLVSAAPFDDLRRHLRRFLQVKDERGRRLLFRFYDPIALTAFLPTCTAPELAELFGPVDAFLVETDAAGEVTELWFDGTALRTRSRAVDSSRGRYATYTPPSALARATPTPGLDQSMLVRDAQMAALRRDVDARFARVLARHLRENHAPATVGLGDDVLAARASAGIARARSWGFTTRRDIQTFVVLMCTIAPNFDEHPPIAAVLRDGERPARIDALLDEIDRKEWRAAAVLRDDGAWSRARS